MSNKKLEAKNVNKVEKPRRNFSFKKLADQFAVIVAFMSLFTLSAYGMKQLLNSLNENVSIAITVLVILLLSYVLFTRRS